MSARYHTVGPVLSGEGSRAYLALAVPSLEPRVLVWLHEDVAKDADAMEAVRRETRRAIQLEHPNIIRVHGLYEVPEGIARVVEYADAESLRRVLELNGPLPPGLAARIVADAAMGVHYAHLAGNDDGTPLIHGDLRPETLLLGYGGATKVGGYAGLAAAPREPGGRRVQGRRQHCAPEQVVGGREALNVQTDVYLLGVLLFELLSGKVPYSELPPNEFDGAVLTHPPPPLPVGERPPELEAVLRRAMAKKAFDRYPTAIAFRDALERAMGQQIATQADVAQLVQTKFPESAHDSPRAARRKMIAAAITKVKEEAANALSTPAAPSPTTSGPRTLPREPTPVRPAPLTSSGTRPVVTTPVPITPPATVAERPAPPPEEPRERRALASIVAALLVVAIAGFGLWAWQSRRGELPAAAENLAPEADAGVDAGMVAEELTDAGALTDADAGALAAAEPDAGEPDAGLELAVLELIVDPPVQVTVDGVALGRAPARYPLEPGRRVLQLVDRKKLINVTRVVDIPAGPGTVRKEYYLGRGFVRITAPDGAEVTIDGTSFGKAPLKEIGVYEGSHQIRVDVGELTWQESFSIKPNERVRFDVDFE